MGVPGPPAPRKGVARAPVMGAGRSPAPPCQRPRYPAPGTRLPGPGTTPRPTGRYFRSWFRVNRIAVWVQAFEEGEMITITGAAHRFCDGVSRRDVLRVGMLGIAGFALSDLFRLRAEASPSGGKATSIIMVHLN